jgi:HK97 family phage major capsid protein
MFVVDSSRLYTVVRRQAEVKADASLFFTSDRVAVRATMRVAFGLVHTQSVVRVRLAAS